MFFQIDIFSVDDSRDTATEASTLTFSLSYLSTHTLSHSLFDGMRNTAWTTGDRPSLLYCGAPGPDPCHRQLTLSFSTMTVQAGQRKTCSLKSDICVAPARTLLITTEKINQLYLPFEQVD